ncbi:MAG: response regulator [Chitinophagaceae bacterium]|nr:response regulator [Chitinophagaceae bacterium]
MTTDRDRKIRVLFADDDEDLFRLVKMKLSSQGFLVSLSLNGERIKEMVLSERPDIILLDVTMNGNDGRDICSHLKEDPQTKAIPVILLSADEGLDAIADQCGADAWVTKPFDAVSVKNKIKDLLSKRSPANHDLL